MRALTREQTEYAVARLVRLVEFRKMTQTQLENVSGVKQSTISKIIAGDGYMPTEETLAKLFKAMGLKLNDILNESDRVAEEILGYMATPLTGLSIKQDTEVRRVVDIVRAVAAGERFVTPRFEIYWPGDHTHPKQHRDISAEQVYVTDRSRASTNDFIILFCGVASYGVGQENEIATQAGVPAIRLMPDGISRMMSGSFLKAYDVKYSGSPESGVVFDSAELAEGLQSIREAYFRSRALYRGLNGDAFGARLRKLVDERSGDYEQFADDVGISLWYLHHMMEEPFAVSNPSIRLLQRIGQRLSERVSFLIGESDETDPVWIESQASWRSWIEKTSAVDAATAVTIRDDWRHEYATDRRQQMTTASHRKSLNTMRETDWDRRYQKAISARAKSDGDRSASLFK